MRKKTMWIAVFSATFLCCLIAFPVARVLRKAPGALPSSSAAQPDVAAASFEDLDKQLPDARLVNLAGVKLDDSLLRHGKVMLVFITPTCKPCLKEAEFLRSMEDHGNVRFYGVISFGDENMSLKVAEGIFPFEVYFDQDTLLARNLNINRVPIKIFLEDGIIKDVWDGVTKTEEARAEFSSWLESAKAGH